MRQSVDVMQPSGDCIVLWIARVSRYSKVSVSGLMSPRVRISSSVTATSRIRKR
ncbi:MAG: hypothetical protein ACI9WU_005092, partial [Myxococcota bacterium]